MSIAPFSLAEASIAQLELKGGSSKKTPSKRTILAFVDRKTVPEPR
jgi:hypothetical protein